MQNWAIRFVISTSSLYLLNSLLGFWDRIVTDYMKVQLQLLPCLSRALALRKLRCTEVFLPCGPMVPKPRNQNWLQRPRREPEESIKKAPILDPLLYNHISNRSSHIYFSFLMRFDGNNSHSSLSVKFMDEQKVELRPETDLEQPQDVEEDTNPCKW